MKPSISLFLKNIFSFETAFVLFLFSYQYKNAHPIFLNPDITLVLIGILIPWALCIKYKSHEPLFTKETLPFILFSIWCVVSAFWAPKSSYTISKTLCFVVYTLPTFFMGYTVIGTNIQRLKRFLVVVLVFSIFVHLEAYRIFYYAHGSIVDVLGNNYLVTGQTLGCGFIILVVWSLDLLQGSLSSRNLQYKSVSDIRIYYWLLILLCGTFFYIQLNLGGRGPVIAVFLVLIAIYIYGFLQVSNRQLYLQHFLHLILVCILSYWLLKWMFTAKTDHFIARTYAFITTPELDDPINWRIGYYHSAINAFLSHPIIGVGFGGWKNHYDIGSLPWQHPHNIVLEVLSETGAIGGVLGVLFAFTILGKIPYKNLTNSLYMTPLCLFFFAIINALKSGDLNDNMLLFVMAGIVLNFEKLSAQTKISQRIS